MIVVIQRVASASVSVNNLHISAINRGYLLLVGIQKQDRDIDIAKMAEKILKLRIMSDEEGKMNRSIVDVHGAILAVSQFTLCANAKKGNRPSFLDAMEPKDAKKLFDLFVEMLRKAVPVEMGSFGDYMQVMLENDGPTTIILDSKDLKQ